MLPPELWGLAFEYQSQRELCALCLVAKDFRDVAQRMLFQNTVVVDAYDALPLLQNAPKEAMGRVRSVRVAKRRQGDEVRRRRGEEYWNAFNVDFAAFLARIEHLHRIEIVLEEIPAGAFLTSMLTMHFPTLQELLLPGCWCGQDDALERFVRGHVDLRRLRLHIEPGRPGLASAWRVPATLPRLTEFEGPASLLVQLQPPPPALAHVRLLDGTGDRSLLATRGQTARELAAALTWLTTHTKELVHLDLWSAVQSYEELVAALLTAGVPAELDFLRLTQACYVPKSLPLALEQLLRRLPLRHLVLDSMLKPLPSSYALGQEGPHTECALRQASIACPTLTRVELNAFVYTRQGPDPVFRRDPLAAAYDRWPDTPMFDYSTRFPA